MTRCTRRPYTAAYRPRAVRPGKDGPYISDRSGLPLAVIGRRIGRPWNMRPLVATVGLQSTTMSAK
jgi:hypothetical protein